MRLGKFMDLTGMVFGRLTVLERADDYISKSGYRQVQWKCKCNCINKTILVVSGNDLKTGNTKSCGCYKKEMASIAHKKYNPIEYCEDYMIMYTLKGEPFYIDTEDYDKVKDTCWHKNSHGYIVDRNSNGIHRVIMNCPDGLDVDHIHGTPSICDNRKSNLRIVNASQNNMNKEKQRNNTSGCVGVTWHKKAQKWQAYIKIDNKTKYLGLYAELDDAIKIRKEAEKKYFGEWSYDKSRELSNEGEMV